MTGTIRTDLTNDAYHADTSAISKSGLDLIARSPAHFYARYLDPAREPVEPTDAMEFGTAFHAAILEPDKFAARYCRAPALDRRTKAGREAFAAFVADNPGRQILTAEDYDTCLKMRAACEQHASVATLIKDGQAEQSFFWTAKVALDDGVDEVMCKCRPDWLRADGVIVDIKTTEDARQEAFTRSAWNYRYHVQAPWYCDGVSQVLDQQVRLFVFVAIEKKPPYAIATYFADERMMAAGRAEYERNLRTYTACLRDRYWPAYAEQIVPLSLPYWAEKAAAREVV